MSTHPLPHVASSEASMKRPLPPEVERYAPPRRAVRSESPSNTQDVRQSSFESATDLHRFIEKRSRQLGTAIHVLEQQRQHLRSVEKQRDVVYKELASIMANVAETSEAVKSAAAESEPPADMDRIIESNRAALDQLESVAVSLISNFQFWRSAWEQYTQTCARAKDLKAEMSATEPLTDA